MFLEKELLLLIKCYSQGKRKTVNNYIKVLCELNKNKNTGYKKVLTYEIKFKGTFVK